MMCVLRCSALATSLFVMVGSTASAQDSEAGPGALPAGAIRQLGEVRILNIGHVLSLAFSPDGKTVAATSWDGKVRMWDVATEAAN
jgi:WD40 repeat protein